MFGNKFLVSLSSANALGPSLYLVAEHCPMPSSVTGVSSSLQVVENDGGIEIQFSV